MAEQVHHEHRLEVRTGVRLFAIRGAGRICPHLALDRRVLEAQGKINQVTPVCTCIFCCYSKPGSIEGAGLTIPVQCPICKQFYDTGVIAGIDVVLGWVATTAHHHGDGALRDGSGAIIMDDTNVYKPVDCVLVISIKHKDKIGFKSHGGDIDSVIQCISEVEHTRFCRKVYTCKERVRAKPCSGKCVGNVDPAAVCNVLDEACNTVVDSIPRCICKLYKLRIPSHVAIMACAVGCGNIVLIFDVSVILVSWAGRQPYRQACAVRRRVVCR